jgi:hypothetical protein
MVVLLLAGNASFMAGCVYLPLNIGRLMLTAIRKASMLMTQVCVRRKGGCVVLTLAHGMFMFIVMLLAIRKASARITQARGGGEGRGH